MKKKYAKIREKALGRTTTTWHITFVVIFAAQFLSWILAMEIVVHAVKKQTNEVYDKALNVLVQSYDNSVGLVYSMLDAMALDAGIVRCVDGRSDVWQNEVTRRTLASYKQQYSFIDNIFIYFHDSDRVISVDTVASSKLFYDIYGDVQMSYEDWQKAMKQTYFKQNVSWENGDGGENIWILHTWPVYSEDADSNRITIAVKFNKAYIQRLADNFSAHNFVAVVIRNKEEQIVAESWNVDVVNKKRMVTRTSTLCGWTYTAYMSGKVIRVYEKGLLTVMLACFGSEILICIFAFSFFIKTNYNPFTELMEYVNRQNPSGIVNSSEYVYIRNSFEEIVSKTKEGEEAFVKKLNRMKIGQLIHIMTNDIAIEKVDRHTMEEMKLSFILDSSVVLLISGSIQDFVNRQKDCFAVMQQLGIGLQEDSPLYGCSFSYEETIVCIFKLDADSEDMNNRLIRLWEKVEKEISGKCVMAVSSLKQEGNHLGKAYEEAQFVMQGAERLSVTGLLLYDQIQENVRESVRDNKDEHVVRLVKEYIMQHYAEPDLNVAKLCDDMGKSVSYVSKLFKEKTGQSILYYINMIRIGEAKKLLREAESDISVDEVGKRVGFTNSNSFIRIFKKYEQMTPGKYKEMNQLGLY